MNNLANILSDMRQHQETETLRRDALKIQTKILGPEHPDTLRSMNNLANTLLERGYRQKADMLRKQTLEIRKRVLKPRHPDTLRSMNNLASALPKVEELPHREYALRPSGNNSGRAASAILL